MEHREMRKVINEFLFDQMSKNDRIFLIDADLSIPHGTIDLRKAFPDRALDVGIAEQNMASVAAGIAAAGGTVFIESFAPFATRRACDQIAILKTQSSSWNWSKINRNIPAAPELPDNFTRSNATRHRIQKNVVQLVESVEGKKILTGFVYALVLCVRE